MRKNDEQLIASEDRKANKSILYYNPHYGFLVGIIHMALERSGRKLSVRRL